MKIGKGNVNISKQWLRNTPKTKIMEVIRPFEPFISKRGYKLEVKHIPWVSTNIMLKTDWRLY